MDAERWQKIKSLFDAAQEIEPKKRENFLANACAGDEDLHREVGKLLESFNSAESFMENPAAAEVASMFEDKKTLVANHTTGSLDNGKLVAGTVLASRYRIIGLLGKGGMGEVYKAEDIKLSQTVALKFLPDKLEKDKVALARFHGEVRIARQVSHPNVCRVFDIGEIDGRHFLSMEYVDGDDLSSLLRRIGRLPSERAVEISRQLCVGLHAIHDAGILHRDFKPANIIIDGKGKARITDFGIAGLEAEIVKDEMRVGTPAYMSPEQITGREISQRSDIYALGLVLYEIFTGKQAFQADSIPELIRKHQTETPTNPSEHIKGIDPLVEKVIFQCLEKNPADRPPSALHVAMALPGGNPLQVALEAGETPSPEMVAAAPKKGALKPIVAAGLLAVFFISLISAMQLSKPALLHNLVPLEKSPEVLAERSREIAEQFGYSSADSYYGFVNDTEYLEHIRETDQNLTRWQKLNAGQPAVYQFWYRQSPQPLAPFSFWNLTFNDPPNTMSGMARARLDTKGRLLYFEGVPLQVDEPQNATGDLDWSSVFKEAGFNINDFQPAESEWTPPQAFDERRAWTGVYPEAPDVPIRIEAAAYRGKPVYFEIVEPWSQPARQPSGDANNAFDASDIVLLSIFFGILILSALIALRNVRVGRSDLRGAFRVAVFIFALRMITWAVATHHTSSGGEVMLLITGLQAAVFWAFFIGLIYLAFEPYLRRHTPERVISWNRLLAGDWRDPLVGRDILIGMAIGAVAITLFSFRHHFSVWIGEAPPIPWFISSPNGAALLGIRGFLILLTNQIAASLAQAFMVVFLILFFTMLFRNKWFGVGAAWLLLFVFAFFGSVGSGMILLAFIFPTVLVLPAARFGVLTQMATILTYHLTIFYPVTTNLSAWYAADFVLCMIVLSAVAIFAFYHSLAGQPIFEGRILKEVEG